MLEKRPFRALLVLFYFRSTFDKCCKTKRFCLQGISAETKVSTKQKTATSGSQDNFFSFPTAQHWLIELDFDQAMMTLIYHALNDCHESKTPASTIWFSVTKTSFCASPCYGSIMK